MEIQKGGCFLMANNGMASLFLKGVHLERSLQWIIPFFSYFNVESRVGKGSCKLVGA